jgi:hypothetical protein
MASFPIRASLDACVPASRTHSQCMNHHHMHSQSMCCRHIDSIHYAGKKCKSKQRNLQKVVWKAFKGKVIDTNGAASDYIATLLRLLTASAHTRLDNQCKEEKRMIMASANAMATAHGECQTSSIWRHGALEAKANSCCECRQACKQSLHGKPKQKMHLFHA